MRKFLIFLILLGFTVPANAAPIYKWVDEKGVVNFTDDYSNVPSSYGDRVGVRDYLTEGVAPSYTSEVPPRKKIEAETDIYGRDEIWWREKVHFWGKKLREAADKYEIANNEFMLKAENLSQTNFYGRSRSQTKWDVMELSRLNEKRNEYGSQIAEAEEMLKKLSKEAEEAKANPDWLE
jgi:hypothetical protein